MKCSVEPYEGSQPYIFVSYRHDDKMQVYPYIEMLARDGYRIWYDEGITPGDEWTENIARHLEGCAVFIAFVTEASMNSHNCRREINFAVMREKTMISLFLDDVKLSAGMEMLLSGRQGIFRNKYDIAEEFISKLIGAEGMSACKGDPRLDVQVLDRIGTDDKTVTLTNNAYGIIPSNAETYLLYTTLQQKIYIRKSVFTIGRSEELADFAIPGEPSISRRHMTVRKKGNIYSVIDNRSVNHVGINGKLISPEVEYELAPYDIISLAMEHMVFFQEYDDTMLQTVPDMLLRGSQDIWTIDRKPVVRIGSLPIDRNGKGNEICIQREGIKDFHALIIRTQMETYIADISGTGGTLVDGKPLEYGRKALLTEGCELKLGDQILEVTSII